MYNSSLITLIKKNLYLFLILNSFISYAQKYTWVQSPIYDIGGESINRGQLRYSKKLGIVFVYDREQKVQRWVDTLGHKLPYPSYSNYQARQTTTNGLVVVTPVVTEYGVLDYKGNSILKPIYSGVTIFQKHNVIIATLKDKWGMFTLSGETLLPCEYESIKEFFNNRFGIFKIEKNGLFALADNKGHLLTPFIYKTVEPHPFETFPYTSVLDTMDRCGIIDTLGKIIVPTKYDGIGFIRGNLISLRQAGKSGAYNLSNRIEIDCLYDELFEFNDNNYAKIKIKNQYGLINSLGKIVVPVIYDDVMNRETSFSVVLKQNKYGVVNDSGKEVIPIIYDKAMGISSHGLVGLKQNEKWAIFDTTGKQLSTFKYKNMNLCSIEYLIGEEDSSSFLINHESKPIITEHPCSADLIDGFLSIYRNGKQGLVDSNGIEIIPFKYDDIDDKAIRDKIKKHVLVKQNNKFGIIKLPNKEIAPCIYNSIRANDFGYQVEIENKVGILNNEGLLVVPCEFQDVLCVNKNIYWVQLNDKWGVIKVVF